MREYFDLMNRTMLRMDLSNSLASIAAVNKALLAGTLVCTLGNGGSSSTASHFVNDWVKGLSEKEKFRCRALSLSDCTPILTAIANDLGYENIFSYQVEKYMKSGDVLVCISASGNSQNVIKAAKFARDEGITVVGLTGFDGGKLRRLADLSFHVPINDMQIVEDIHSTFGHLVLKHN